VRFGHHTVGTTRTLPALPPAQPRRGGKRRPLLQSGGAAGAIRRHISERSARARTTCKFATIARKRQPMLPTLTHLRSRWSRSRSRACRRFSLGVWQRHARQHEQYRRQRARREPDASSRGTARHHSSAIIPGPSFAKTGSGKWRRGRCRLTPAGITAPKVGNLGGQPVQKCLRVAWYSAEHTRGACLGAAVRGDRDTN